MRRDIKTARNFRAEWRRNWTLVPAAAMGSGLSTLHLYTFGVYTRPLELEFGWKRSFITIGLTFISVTTLLMAPFIGALIDRLGPRRIALVSATGFCVVSILPALASDQWTWIASWALIALFAPFVKPTVWAAAIVRRFHVARGLAISLSLAGGGLAQMVNPFLAYLLISHFGWRVAYPAMALLWFVLTLPLCFRYFCVSEEADPSDSNAEAAPKGRPPPAGSGFREALLSRPYLWLAISMLLAATATIGQVVQFVPIGVSTGGAPAVVAACAGAIGVSSIVGRIIVGHIIDRFPVHRIGAIIFLFPGLAALVALFGHGVAPLLVMALLIGAAAGSEIEIAAYMTASRFGLRNYGALFGLIVGIMTLSPGISSMLTGFVYDRFGDYRPFHYGCVPVSAIASLMLLSINRVGGQTQHVPPVPDLEAV